MFCPCSELLDIFGNLMAQDIMIFSDIHGNLDNSNIDFTNYVTSTVTVVEIMVALLTKFLMKETL